MTDGTEYLRAADIAQITGVSIRTARRWIARNVLASVKLGGARLVAKSELERLTSSCGLPEDSFEFSDKNDH